MTEGTAFETGNAADPARGFVNVGSRVVSDLGFLTVTVRDIRVPTGEVVERIVVEHPGAVGVVPLIDDDIILIEQYRAPMERSVLEIPAGKLDTEPPDPLLTAQRELEEEVGYTAGTLTLLTEVWTAVGFTNERISLYLGEDLEPGVRTPIGHEEMAATVVRMPFASALDMVVSGDISDAKSVAGILLAARRGPS